GREPGVVDEDLDVEAQLADLLGQRSPRAGVGKVARDRLRAHSMTCRQLRGELVEALLATRDQDDAMSAPRQLVCDRTADAGRGAGDQRSRGGGGRWQAHVA